VRYRVETLEWPADAEGRLEALRTFVAERGSEWLLVQIGSPTEHRVPLLFRLRSGTEEVVATTVPPAGA
jgi:hypothetical protein